MFWAQCTQLFCYKHAKSLTAVDELTLTVWKNNKKWSSSLRIFMLSLGQLWRNNPVYCIIG